jgi:hypothetical protein
MPRVGFELRITVFERAKTVHTLDSVATAIVSFEDYCLQTQYNYLFVIYLTIPSILQSVEQ